MQNNTGRSISIFIFWVKHILLVILSCFFLLFGVHILIAAYQLNDPFTFILTFFAANFIILISATLVFVFIYRIKIFYSKSNSEKTSGE